jgi:hypothetical protein
VSQSSDDFEGFGQVHIKKLDESLSDYFEEDLDDSIRTRRLKAKNKGFREEKEGRTESLEDLNREVQMRKK